MAAAVLAAMMLAACGGGGGNDKASTTPAPAAPPPPPPVEPPPVTPPPSGIVGADYVPLFASGTPILEQIQHTEADGTLVTYAGFRPTPRHAREGGEDWTDPVDRGPGSYLAFPSLYFQNRTFGLVIRDEVPAGRQRITAYLRSNAGIMVDTAFNAFRRVDPGVGEYGWQLNTGLSNPIDGSQRCGPTEKIEEMCVAGGGRGTILDYWRYGDEQKYIGNTRPDNRLQIGDKIEMTGSTFLDHAPDSNVALIDGGPIRYYSLEQMYVVGKGFVPWYGTAPKLDTTPLPDATLLGGLASVSYNYSEEPHRVFQQSATNIGIANMQRFVEGRRLFHTSFLDGRHSENPNANPVFAQHVNQLGTRFNQERCLGCHSLNGRSPAAEIGERLNTMNVLTAAVSSTGARTPDPTYGLSVQQLARDANAPDYSVTIQSYQTTQRRLPDGEVVELRKPVYAFTGAVPANYSVRQAPQVIGMGLLEAIDETTILALADPDDSNGDGVRGVPNFSVDPETGLRHLGRFGWKAGKGSLRQQAGTAFLLDMGVTTPVYKAFACQLNPASTDCKNATAASSVSAAELDRLSNYLQLLGVPAQRSLRSGYTDGTVTPPEHQVDEAKVARGQELFAQAQCSACHVAQIRTGGNHPLAELRNQTIRPYTDLLLHDMGSEMADTLTEGEAAPNLWRTQPLWGLGSLKYVQKGTGQADPQSVRYLHDGRARTLTEAIAWHGGEAAGSRARFEAMARADRDAILAFLESL
ncbi:MAG TPA: thiol oxidoreductase [Xanthomonadaceae bacterium]|nr:thiol oxidoreductase [Xanthomonadaceae bacterium]